MFSSEFDRLFFGQGLALPSDSAILLGHGWDGERAPPATAGG